MPRCYPDQKLLLETRGSGADGTVHALGYDVQSSDDPEWQSRLPNTAAIVVGPRLQRGTKDCTQGLEVAQS